MKSESSLMRKTAADGLTLSTSPSSCCTGCVSVLHGRDIEQIYNWKMMPWMVTHKDLKPRINLLPTLFQTNALVLPLSWRRERASKKKCIFRLIPFTTGKKWNKPLCCSAALDRLCCNTLKPSDVLLHHRMHVNTRLQLRPEVRAACARALWKPFLSLCFCLLITWHHKPSKTERDSQRLVQIMVLRTQTAPRRDQVGGMLLNATWRWNFKHILHFWKTVFMQMNCLSDESVFAGNDMHHTELTFERNKWIIDLK